MGGTFDAIVLGVGGMGSAACLELARRGQRVLGLEQFPLVHARGSSHGQTRIIRTAYAEHPSYVPLVRRPLRSGTNWNRRPAGICSPNARASTLARPRASTSWACGNRCASIGSRRRRAERQRDQSPLPGVRATGRLFGRPRRGRRLPVRWKNACARRSTRRSASGQTFAPRSQRGNGRAVGDGVEVTTDRGTYRAAKLIVTAGAWATRLLADIGVPLAVMRQTLLWFDVGTRPPSLRRDRFPIFIADVPGEPFYGTAGDRPLSASRSPGTTGRRSCLTRTA